MGAKNELLQTSYSKDDKERFVKCKSCGFTQSVSLIKENSGCCTVCGAAILRVIGGKKKEVGDE